MKGFDYLRKSTDVEDKQTLSLKSQALQINLIPTDTPLQILSAYTESKSAKIPYARKMFNEMMDRIEAGEGQFIRCWKLNRLARNPIDGARIIWAVQNGLKLITSRGTFTKDDIRRLYDEFGSSHEYVNNLSYETKVGTDNKLAQGKVPIIAPIGYLNTPERAQGLREIIVDQVKFPIVRKMWDLLLSGTYSVNKIHEIAIEEWDLTGKNGKQFSKSQAYELFRNIFYTGKYYNYNGNLYSNGVHTPMITIDEFDLAQKLLGSKGKPREVTREFSYTNWIHCICGSTLKAEVRVRKWCSRCQSKHNAEKYDVCPKCGDSLSENTMIDVRYMCNRKRNPLCRQPSISLSLLEKLIDAKLAKFDIPQKYMDWARSVLKEQHEKESLQRQAIEVNLDKNMSAMKRKLDNLTTKWLDPENAEILPDERYREMRKEIEEGILKLEKERAKTTKRQKEWHNTAERIFIFSKNARYWFKHGTKQQKRAIFQAIGSDPKLENGLLRFDLLKPLQVLEKMAQLGKTENEWFGPQEKGIPSSQNDFSDMPLPILYPVPDSNRRSQR